MRSIPMNTLHAFSISKSPAILTLLALLLATPILRAADTSTNQNEVLGNQVLQLLKTRDTGKFASELTASVQDWQNVRTNAPKPGTPEFDIKAEESRMAYEKQKISSSAEQVINQATRLGL